MMDFSLFDIFRFCNFDEISLAVLKNQPIAPATTQTAFTLHLFYERAFTANLRHHLIILTFGNQERVARVRVYALSLWERRLSLRKQPHMVFAELHEDSAHVGRIFSLQRSCPEHVCIEFFGAIGIHNRNDKMIQMSNISFSLCFSAHGLFSFLSQVYLFVVLQLPYGEANSVRGTFSERTPDER